MLALNSSSDPEIPKPGPLFSETAEPFALGGCTATSRGKRRSGSSEHERLLGISHALGGRQILRGPAEWLDVCMYALHE